MPVLSSSAIGRHWHGDVSYLVLVNLEIYMCALKRKFREMQIIKIRDMELSKRIYIPYKFHYTIFLEALEDVFYQIRE